MAKKRVKIFTKGKEKDSCRCNSCGPCRGGIYFLGFIGAVVYYIQQANGFWQVILGILKAIVWPAFLVYKLLGF